MRRIFAETFKIPADSVGPDMSPENVVAWDSFGHMRLITAIEAQLPVRLTMEQIVSIDRFATLWQLVDEACKGKERAP